MSVLIKGMSMPKECVKAEIYKDKDDKWMLAVKDKEYYTDTGFVEEFTLYELVEVPTPHGGLIDKDLLLKEFVGINDGWLKPQKNWRSYEDSVRFAETIIEAEVEE